MLKKILKKYIPLWLWQNIKLAKTIPTQVILKRSGPKPAYLEFSQIENLINSSSQVADYPYDERACRQRGIERANFLTSILSGSTTNKNILELGCADTMTSLALKEKGFNAIALDIVDQRQEPAKNSDIRFIQSAAESIPLDSQSVDFVFSYNALEHFEDPQKVLTEVHRLLKPGGCFYTEFDPLYYSPRGLHAYRKINIPYLQILFKMTDLKKYADLHQLNWEDLPYVNGYTLVKFRTIWQNMTNEFSLKTYQEIIDVSALDLIKKYPSCFKKENFEFKNFITSGLKILAIKK